MYTQWIYNAFVQLRKQYYKLKTRDSIDRYTKIEFYKKDYKTFRRFCDEIDEFNVNIFFWKVLDVQDTFEILIDHSQKNTLKYIIY